MKYVVYTDGACSGNPGPGGWGAVILDAKNIETNISGKEESTTNNRMELMIYTDSTYLKNGITVWIKNWEKNGWKNAYKKPVKNKDLWVMLNELSKEQIIEWKWVKAHAGNKYNEIADKLATDAINKLDLF